MYITKCPYCQSSQVKKNGLCQSVQLYKCKCCGKQFPGSYHRSSFNSIWQEYLEGKQTILEIANKHHVSESTIKRCLRKQVIGLWRKSPANCVGIRDILAKPYLRTYLLIYTNICANFI